MIKAFHPASLATFASLALCATAMADFQTMSQRLPASSDAIVAVNVQKLVASPYGKNAEWGQKLAESWDKQPLMIPPGAKRLLMAADVKPSSMESIWELSLIEMTKLPTLDALVSAEGGHVDRVFDKDAVYSPINAYFVPLEDNVLASITPAERSQIARWVRQPIKPEGSVTSEYIKTALTGLSDKTDIVMAMDLQGAYGVPAIRKWLGINEIPEVKSEEINALAQVLGTMEGITLEIRVDDKIHGKAIVTFDRDATILRETAKPIMLAMLNQVGMRIDEIPNWTSTAAGKQITMEGELSDVSLRRLLSIVQSPVPAATEAEPASGGAQQVAADPAQASQRYFKAISSILQTARAGGSPAANATWIRNASKRIDQLPILNVDPALVEWGIMVSARLKQAAGVLSVGQTQMDARVAGVASTGYEYSDYDSSDAANSAQRKATENTNKQRRQAALEQRAQTGEQALAIVNELAESQLRIRAEMVGKYKVEF